MKKKQKFINRCHTVKKITYWIEAVAKKHRDSIDNKGSKKEKQITTWRLQW